MRARNAFHTSLVELLRAGRSPYDALREASAAHLGTAGETETVARVALALAHDFEREVEARVVGAPNALARIAEGYLQAVEQLRDAPEHELNLPFLTATATGPRHLSRKLTPAILAQLAQRDPGAGTAPAQVAATPEPTPATAPLPKKKRFWLF